MPSTSFPHPLHPIYFLTTSPHITSISPLPLTSLPLPQFPHHITLHHITLIHITQSEPWQRLLELEVGNCRHRLFGGAQYHRAIREFTVNYTVDNASFLRLILEHITLFEFLLILTLLIVYLSYPCFTPVFSCFSLFFIYVSSRLLCDT